MKEARFKFNGITPILIGLALVVLFAWLNLRLAGPPSVNDHFFPAWNRARLFLSEGLDPYSPKAARQTQREVYGRTARSGEDKLLFPYPPYAMLFYAPFASTGSYMLARAAWQTGLQVSLLAIAVCSAVMTGWRPSWPVYIFYLLFSLGWYFGLHPLMLGNLSILVAMFTTLALLCILYRQYHLAGILLALASIKPNMVVLLIPFILWWVYSHRRLVLISYFTITLTLLAGSAFLIQPGWLLGYLRQLLDYMQYAPAGTPAAIFNAWWPGIGLQIGRGLSILTALVLLREWTLAFRKDEQWFLWTCSLTLAATPLIGVQTSVTDAILIFPALTVLFALWEHRWQRAGRWVAVAMMGFLLLYPWLRSGWQAIEGQPLAAMFFLLPTILIFALYWMRYWTLSVRKLPAEDFENQIYY